ncbi:MAG TPA: OmpH family outer membrane protein [Anseongella sp.]|nr:OmpH family outer membrane protein [Anseongella sp.]
MKQKITPGLKLIAAALIAAAAASCNQPAPAARNNAPDSLQTVADAIVYVNSDTLLAKYEYFKDLQKELESKGKTLENQVSSRTASFQKQVSAYQQNAATMTPGERQSTEQNLGKAQQELQALQQKAGQDMMKNEQEANDKLHAKVQAFLKEYAAMNDYKFVLTYSRSNNAVLFADSTLDVTAEVLNGLNAAYAKEKK